jgi:hypothetical protein
MLQHQNKQLLGDMLMLHAPCWLAPAWMLQHQNKQLLIGSYNLFHRSRVKSSPLIALEKWWGNYFAKDDTIMEEF